MLFENQRIQIPYDSAGRKEAYDVLERYRQAVNGEKTKRHPNYWSKSQCQKWFRAFATDLNRRVKVYEMQDQLGEAEEIEPATWALLEEYRKLFNAGKDEWDHLTPPAVAAWYLYLEEEEERPYAVKYARFELKHGIGSFARFKGKEPTPQQEE